MEMLHKRTELGFRRAEFKDVNETECFIQEGTAGTLWIGIKRDVYEEIDEQVFAMQLNSDQVEALLPALRYFAKHGKLPGLGVFEVHGK